MIIKNPWKKQFKVYSFQDFVDTFNLSAQAAKYYELTGNEWYYGESKKFVDDNTEIKRWLKKSKKKYVIDFIDDGHQCEHWLIREVR